MNTNTKEYRILQANTIQELQVLVNQALVIEKEQPLKSINLFGGMICEVYPGFPPLYYQTLLINEQIPQQPPQELLLEKVEISNDEVKMIPTVFNQVATPVIESTCEIKINDTPSTTVSPEYVKSKIGKSIKKVHYLVEMKQK